MYREGSMSLQKRKSQKTGKEYTVLVFAFTDGSEILIFDEKVKAQFLEHVIDEYAVTGYVEEE